jgi:long-chain acyl-CoA synthetase
VSVYDTLGPDAASFIAADSGSEVLVCEDKTFKKVPAILDDEIYTKNKGAALKVVVFTGKGDAEAKAKIEAKGLKVVGMAEAISEVGSDVVPDTPPTRDDLVTIMYTSGTTGMPKGVMLTHKNIVATISCIDTSISLNVSSADVHLSYLPLAHIFERQICGGMLKVGATRYFASQGAKFLLVDLGIIQPTIFAGVPKVYENVRDAVKRKMTGFKKKLFDSALAAKIADLETGCDTALSGTRWSLARRRKLLADVFVFACRGEHRFLKTRCSLSHARWAPSCKATVLPRRQQRRHSRCRLILPLAMWALRWGHP